ncbi:PfkB domain protein (plasmid) [Gemmatirosa kalamazoonensis]|uniref:PfkB domain protein n=1 Tax=Gemmatirosa kalamazoonensis TaxID=861299 RepID=W0RSU1_9BACT|nr:carbohydrate kinase family protein [Gemmatirosa kalamazoonensis]AHG92648.1 PfkB domain protein [Gemmatirosa kalamazoonensis]
MPRLGVIGTLVWDVIYGSPPKSERVEGWGGLAYALSGLDAALADDWEIVPLIKVGHDVAEPGRAFVSGLRHAAADAALVEVPEPNNRSELRYHDDEHRTEFMSGGVPGWRWDELAPRLEAARIDALYVNFLSGWEIDLDVAQRLRASFAGPIYVDLHMMLWAVQSTGMRQLRPLERATAWCRCFDFIQVNEDEMSMLAPDPDAFAALALGAGARATMVTLGPRGVVYHAAPGFRRLGDTSAGASSGASSEALGIALASDAVRRGPEVDPTGCGDVWGATAFARLLAGDALADALRCANERAGRNAEFHGVAGLVAHLSNGCAQGRT